MLSFMVIQIMILVVLTLFSYFLIRDLKNSNTFEFVSYVPYTSNQDVSCNTQKDTPADAVNGVSTSSNNSCDHVQTPLHDVIFVESDEVLKSDSSLKLEESQSDESFEPDFSVKLEESQSDELLKPDFSVKLEESQSDVSFKPDSSLKLEESQSDDMSSHTVKTLREIASKKGIKSSKMNKKQLLKVLSS